MVIENLERRIAGVGIIDDMLKIFICLILNAIQRFWQKLLAVIHTGNNTYFWCFCASHSSRPLNLAIDHLEIRVITARADLVSMGIIKIILTAVVAFA